MIFVVLAVGLGLIPAFIAQSKGRSFAGWWLFGAALFPVALATALVIEPIGPALERRALANGMVKCPYCAELVRAEARICRHCRSDLVPRRPL